MKKELSLKGSKYGSIIIKKYLNPDILYSFIDNHKCYQNKLSITYQNNKYFVYHSYNDYNKKYSGRWYDANFSIDNCNLDENRKILTILLKNTEWGNFDDNTTIKKDVEIKIFLTQCGYNKLRTFYNM